MDKVDIFDEKEDYPRHESAHPSGGIWLKDEGGKMKDVIVGALKKAGAQLLDGSVTDLFKISRPALISWHKTYLESIAIDFTNTSFLTLAAHETDPIRRMKYFITFIVSSISKTTLECMNRGPLNPILGETYQAYKDDGTRIFCEQISHHPPISSFMICGPEDCYKLYGTGELDAKMTGLNNITGRRVGKSTIEFKNGGKIVYNTPDMRIDSLVIGERKLNFIKTFVCLDKGNKISAEITFNYDESGTITKVANKIKSLFKSQKEAKTPTDFFDAEIFSYEKGKEKKLLASGYGSWLSFIQFEGEIFWRVTKQEEHMWKSVKSRLPSDSTFREDAQLIALNDFERAQIEKDRLENLQRADKKLREEYKKKK